MINANEVVRNMDNNSLSRHQLAIQVGMYCYKEGMEKAKTARSTGSLIMSIMFFILGYLWGIS